MRLRRHRGFVSDSRARHRSNGSRASGAAARRVHCRRRRADRKLAGAGSLGARMLATPRPPPRAPAACAAFAQRPCSPFGSPQPRVAGRTVRPRSRGAWPPLLRARMPCEAPQQGRPRGARRRATATEPITVPAARTGSERVPAPGALARLRDPDAAGTRARRRRLRLRAHLRARAGRRPAPPQARAPARAYARRPRSPVGAPARRHAAGAAARRAHSSTSSRGRSGVRSLPSPWLGWGGGELGACGVGRIRATRGWISVDRGSKATLPLTMPRRVFKSSAKDSARRPSGIALQGGRPRPLCRGGCACDASPWGPRAPTADREANGGLGPRFTSLDSDLEAFSHNPAHGSFAPLAFQPSAMTNCVNQRFLSY
jgi:hypothetical protein